MLNLVIGFIAGVAIGGAGKWTVKKLKQAVKKLKEVRKQWRN